VVFRGLAKIERKQDMLELNDEHRKRYEMEHSRKVESGAKPCTDIVKVCTSATPFRVPSDLLREAIIDAHVDPLSKALINNPLVSYREEDLNVQIEKVEIVTKTVITVVKSK
tara:strand:+ start:34 stop:369 length:336 start_codon:yes stop_codon:yes gene_type:complete